MGFALLAAAILLAGMRGARADRRSYALIGMAAIGIGIWMTH